MNVNVHKNRAMSRCAGERRDILESHIFNVMKFLRVIFSMSRRSRGPGFKRRDVLEGENFNVATL